MKLLTVTIPCYNSQDYMEKCIKSLIPGGNRVPVSYTHLTLPTT